ncbi:MAG: ribonuclease PH [Acidobacteriaceae bacterium]
MTIYRSDHRALNHLRPVKITPDFISTAEGSALIEIGNTRVICTASIEESVPSFLRNSGKGWITAEYGMLPRATLTRSPREAARGRIGGRTHEIQRLIGRSLRSTANLKLLGERSIHLDCDVIQADGGTRTASISGAYVALAIACRKLQEAGSIKSFPINASVAAISVGIVDGAIMLDLAYEEDSRAEVDCNVVLTGEGKLVEVQATAEQAPFDDAQLAEMIALAKQGCGQLATLQQQAICSAN